MTDRTRTYESDTVRVRFDPTRCIHAARCVDGLAGVFDRERRPWIDLTHTTESFLPAAPMGIGTDLGLVLLGMVLPYWVVVGSFAAAMVHALGSPVLYHMGVLQHWRPGMDTILTNFANDVDVWMSVYIGAGAAVGLIGAGYAIHSLWKARRQRKRICFKRQPGSIKAAIFVAAGTDGHQPQRHPCPG